LYNKPIAAVHPGDRLRALIQKKKKFCVLLQRRLRH